MIYIGVFALGWVASDIYRYFEHKKRWH